MECSPFDYFERHACVGSAECGVSHVFIHAPQLREDKPGSESSDLSLGGCMLGLQVSGEPLRGGLSGQQTCGDSPCRCYNSQLAVFRVCCCHDAPDVWTYLHVGTQCPSDLNSGCRRRVAPTRSRVLYAIRSVAERVSTLTRVEPLIVVP